MDDGMFNLITCCNVRDGWVSEISTCYVMQYVLHCEIMTISYLFTGTVTLLTSYHWPSWTTVTRPG